jgi:uncharacterized membrane protein YagU involved in acid resistance
LLTYSRPRPCARKGSSVPTEAAAGRRRWLVVAAAGLLAGAFDLTFAFVFYGQQGASPARILRSIASGVLGHDAFKVGDWVLPLGAALHFFIALCAAFVYWFVSRRIPVLIRRPVVCGGLFGVGMYLFMHCVVLPLSQIGFHMPSAHNIIGELFSHVFLFGMVIALGAARAARVA